MASSSTDSAAATNVPADVASPATTTAAAAATNVTADSASATTTAAADPASATTTAAATNVPADVASPATTTAAAATNVTADPASATTTAAATNVPADVASPATTTAAAAATNVTADPASASTTAAATNVPADIANPDPAPANPWKQYTPLLYASIRGDWESAMQFLDQNPNATKDPITDTGHTALIIAVRAGKFKFAEKLLLRMQPEDLRHKDFEDFTVLHHAATKGNSKTTAMFVRKCPDLTQIPNNYGETPLLGPGGAPVHKAQDLLMCIKENR